MNVTFEHDEDNLALHSFVWWAACGRELFRGVLNALPAIF